MRIIKQGSLSKKEYFATCKYCNTEFAFELNETVGHYINCYLMWRSVKCPFEECGHIVRLKPSMLEGSEMSVCSGKIMKI